MKIGIDIRTLMDKQYSGVSEFTLNLVEHLLKLDSENEYEFFYNTAHDISNRMPEFKQANVRVIKKNYPNKIFNYLMQKNLGIPKLDRLLGVDIFFAPHLNFIALSGKAKSVLTIHDLSFMRYPEFFSVRKNFWHRTLGVKKLADSFDKVVAISENTKSDIIELLKIQAEKVEVIYSAISPEFKKVGIGDINFERVKQRYNLPEKFILFLGTIEPRKNVSGLISAYEKFRDENNRLSDVKLVIAGASGWGVKDVFKLWQASRYKNEIKFLDYVERTDKVYLYNLASVFVYPSIYEGFGFPPLEAMSCGTPVITSFSSSLPEVVGGAAILVDPYNITDISSAIKQILSDNELVEVLRLKGVEQAKKFSWDKTAREYLEVFEKILK